MLKIGFCVSGNGGIFCAAVANAATLGVHVEVLFVEEKANRLLERFCEEHSIRYEKIASSSRAAFDRELTQRCIDSRLDLLCLTFDKILPAELVSAYRGRIINVHPGLLPAFAGMNALRRCLASGARFAGATVHEVDEGIDTGAIVAQCVTVISADDDMVSLGKKLYDLMMPMTLQVIAWYAQARVRYHESGRIHIEGAHYGSLPVSPANELPLPLLPGQLPTS